MTLFIYFDLLFFNFMPLYKKKDYVLKLTYSYIMYREPNNEYIFVKSIYTQISPT